MFLCWDYLIRLITDSSYQRTVFERIMVVVVGLCLIALGIFIGYYLKYYRDKKKVENEKKEKLRQKYLKEIEEEEKKKKDERE